MSEVQQLTDMHNPPKPQYVYASLIPHHTPELPTYVDYHTQLAPLILFQANSTTRILPPTSTTPITLPVMLRMPCPRTYTFYSAASAARFPSVCRKTHFELLLYLDLCPGRLHRASTHCNYCPGYAWTTMANLGRHERLRA